MSLSLNRAAGADPADDRLYPGFLASVIVNVLRLHPNGPPHVETQGAGVWGIAIVVDFKAPGQLDLHLQELTWLLREDGRQHGIEHGGVSLVFTDLGDSLPPLAWPVSHAWAYRFDRRGVFKVKPEAVQSRRPIAGGARYAIRLFVPRPQRPEDGRGFLRFHPPQAGKLWKAMLPLPFDATTKSGTLLCHRRFGGAPLNLDPEVTEWCDDHIGPCRFLPMVATMLFRSDADCLAFRFRWF